MAVSSELCHTRPDDAPVATTVFAMVAIYIQLVLCQSEDAGLRCCASQV